MHKDSRNGILVPENSGFYVNLSRAYKTIEFFYTPDVVLKSGLIKSDNTEYSWNQNGSINKTNIESIFVNGQDFTTETSISNIFTENNLHHVIINFTEADNSIFTINYKSTGSVRALYQYMSFYENSLDYNKIIEHYNLYTSKSSYQSAGATISMSENSVNLYNNDWLVIQNV
jgi:allantoicase